MSPTGFPDEATLHTLVEETPQLLPLAGEPKLVVLGREVPIGGGAADLIAVEPTGRVVIVEVKLASNAEARRAVVAQILGYAAFLRGTALHDLQDVILKSSLEKRQFSSVVEAVVQADQTGALDASELERRIEESLASGRFRLVLVLDKAPPELVRIIGYLESLAPELVIDLITVSAYNVGEQRVLVPQRIEPSQAIAPILPRALTATATANKVKGHLIDPSEFEKSIEQAKPSEQPLLRQMFSWAKSLEEEGLIRLLAYRGESGGTTLLPYLLDDEAGLLTVWGLGGVSLWRSVFERHVPDVIPKVEELIAPVPLGQGRVIKSVSPELLAVLSESYLRSSGHS